MKSPKNWCLLTLSILAFLSVSLGLEQCAHEPDSLCFDPTCATPILDAHSGVACECTDENIGATFSECNPFTNTRKLFYFWRPPATCIGGVLPSPVDGIPCNLLCGAGTFLDIQENKCNSCPNGTRSLGDGHRWDRWEELPAQFSTYCAIGTAGQNCSSWKLLGDYIESGNNYYSSYLESILELRIRLVMQGSLRFEYRVSAEEGYDGLYLVIDDLGVFFDSNSEWTTYSIQLDEGYHTIQWQYFKDRTVTQGEDKAYIRSIEVTGTTYGVINCEECPLGYYQDEEGQSTCKKCPAGTFNDDTIGADKCQPCPSWGYSFEGATYCIPRRSCDVNYDITSYYTPCINGVRTKKYAVIQPLACDPTNITLPPDVDEICSFVCPPGSQENNGNCVYCAPGFASIGGPSCQECLAGSAGSPRIRKFDNFTNSASISGTGIFTSSCLGSNCYASTGWRYANSYMDSGLGHGSNTQSYLALTYVAYEGAQVNFTYAVQCNSEEDSLVFTVDDYIIDFFQCNTCDLQWESVSYDLYWDDEWEFNTHEYTLKWSYAKASDVETGGCDRALLKDLSISHIASGLGGSSNCESCLGGTYTDQDKQSVCLACEAGQYSEPNSQSCLSCPNGTVADRPGTPVCIECGSNTYANKDNTLCNYTCSSIFFPNDNGGFTTYDLSKLGYEWNVTYGDKVFTGNICGKSSLCNHLGLCLIDPNYTNPIDMGRHPAITELAGSTGVKFTFRFGTQVGENRCNSQISLRCDPAVAHEVPTLVNTEQLDAECTAYFIWPTIRACPLCTDNDYTFTDTDCRDGAKVRTYFWTNALCSGGVPLPDQQVIQCSAEVSFYWRTVVIASVLGGVTVLAAVGGLIFLYIRNKKLYTAYETLKHRDVPLHEEPSSNDQPDDDFVNQFNREE